MLSPNTELAVLLALWMRMLLPEPMGAHTLAGYLGSGATLLAVPTCCALGLIAEQLQNMTKSSLP